MRLLILVILCAVAQGATTNRVVLPPIRVVGEAVTSPDALPDSVQKLSLSSLSSGTLAGALSQSPSVMLKESGGVGSSPEFLLRGQGSLQNRYFLSGVPIQNAQHRASPIELIYPGFIKEVELHAGHVPHFYGEDGLGGVVDFRLPRNLSGSSIDAKVGSFGYFGVGGKGALHKNLSLGIEATRAIEDYTFFDNNGTPFNPDDDRLVRREQNRFQRFSLIPFGSIQTSKKSTIHYFSLNAISAHEVPGPTFAPSSGELDTFYNVSSLGYRWDSGPVQLETAFFGVYLSEALRKPSRRSSIQASRSKSFSLGWKNQVDWRLSKQLNVKSTAQVSRETYALEALSKSNTTEQWKLPLSLGASFSVGKVRIVPAVVGYFYLNRSETKEMSQVLASPRLVSQVSLSKNLRLRGLVGKFVRSPSLFEVYGSPNGVSENLSLRSENAWKFEAGVDAVLQPQGFINKVSISFTAGVAFSKDLIAHVQNAQNSQVAVNIGASQVSHQEVALKIKSESPLSMDLSLNFLQGINKTEIAYQKDKSLPGRPQANAKVALSYKGRRWKARYTASFVGPSYWDLANSKKMGSLLYHSLGVSWDSNGWGEIVVEGQNLSDLTTTQNQYADTSLAVLDNTTGFSGYPAPGRRIYVSWKMAI